MPSAVNASPVDEQLRAELSAEDARHEEVMGRLMPGDRAGFLSEFGRHMARVGEILHGWCARSGGDGGGA